MKLFPFLAALAFFPGFLTATEDPALGEWRGDDDAGYAYDGVFYSFANEAGQGIKLWLPPGDQPVRGVILFGNPGGGFGGDTRDKTRQRELLEFASWHGFGVAGVTGFPSSETFEKLGQHVLKTFAAWARRGAHPELAHVPFVFSGSSNAGAFSFAMMMLAPERTIAATPNVGPRYVGRIDDRTRAVPAWIHIGLQDPFFPDGMELTEALFAEHLPKGALWTWEAEVKGHANGSSDHVDLAYWNAVIPRRLPESSTRGEPVVLRAIDRANGWWTDLRSWDHAIVRVGPMATVPKDDPGRYGWVPDEAIARLYQAAATRTRPLTLAVDAAQVTRGGETGGTFLSAGGSVLASPGETLKLRVEFAPMFRATEPIEVFDGVTKIADIDPQTRTAEFTVPADRPVLALYALTRSLKSNRKDFAPRISNPVQIVVRNPALTKRIDEQLAAATFPASLRTQAPPAAGPAAPKPAGVLSAPFLSAAAVKEAREDGATAAFWDGGSAPPSVALAGKNEGTVQAAYSAEGLFLRFRVREALASDPARARIDFHLASLPLAALQDEASARQHYAYARVYALLRRAHQFAFAIDDAPEGKRELSLNRWEPWDRVPNTLSSADGFAGTGIWIDRAEASDGFRSFEVFLPWKVVGNPGFAGMPPAGTSLAAVISFMWGETPEERAIWPSGKNPWQVQPAADVYGEVKLLPPAN